jgi:hypothetical protein
VTDTFNTLIVPAALATAARDVAAALSPAGHGMFVSGLSADGSEPATHFVSTGMIHSQFAALLAMDDPQALSDTAAAGAAAQGLPVTWSVDDCAALLAQSDVSTDPPFDAFARLGLQLVQPEEVIAPL